MYRENSRSEDCFSVEILGKFPEMSVERAIDVVKAKLRKPIVGTLG